MKKRKEKTFDKKIEKDLKIAKRSLNNLKKMECAYEEYAKRVAEIWIDEHQRY